MDMWAATEEAYKNGYSKGHEDGKNKIEPCDMCDNARVNEELTDNDDYHSRVIGTYSKECRIMLTAGWGRPLRIEVEKWNEDRQCWHLIGQYYPKHCPECGREIKEYKN